MGVIAYKLPLIDIVAL